MDGENSLQKSNNNDDIRKTKKIRTKDSDREDREQMREKEKGFESSRQDNDNDVNATDVSCMLLLL